MNPFKSRNLMNFYNKILYVLVTFGANVTRATNKKGGTCMTAKGSRALTTAGGAGGSLL